MQRPTSTELLLWTNMQVSNPSPILYLTQWKELYLTTLGLFPYPSRKTSKQKEDTLTIRKTLLLIQLEAMKLSWAIGAKTSFLMMLVTTANTLFTCSMAVKMYISLIRIKLHIAGMQLLIYPMQTIWKSTWLIPRELLIILRASLLIMLTSTRGNIPGSRTMSP